MSAMELDEQPEDATMAVAGAASSKKAKLEAKALARPWVEKYRPSSSTSLVAHKDIISVLRRLIEADKLPHTLLYGPPGTGKTSTILAAAKTCTGAGYKSMTLELNASDDRGIDVVRDQIKEFAGTRRLFSKGIKLIILDEADMMTKDAQFALRRVIEKSARPDIAAAENVAIGTKATDALLELGKGDMRRVLNVLQAAAVAYPGEPSSAAAPASAQSASTSAAARQARRSGVWKVRDLDALGHDLAPPLGRPRRFASAAAVSASVVKSTSPPRRVCTTVAPAKP
ncbi:hypothetical protein JL721_7034 [Aureococcus anophagefferens]|nr:hypothetical protein JL721_7034 [Aureococcus anophagefferens]